MKKGKFNRRLVIEARAEDDGLTAAGTEPWHEVGRTWAEVLDVLPSRAERMDDGFETRNHPARVRTPFRRDIDASMRFVMGDRVMQIVSGPAEIGHREGLEFMVADYSPAGGRR